MSSPDSVVDTVLDALQERAKELTCLYRVERDLQPAARLARRDLPGRHRRPPAGLAVPRRLPGADHGGRRGLRAAGLDRHPVGAGGADPRAGRSRGQRRGVLPRGRCPRPTRDRFSRRRGSSSTRSPSASASSSCTASCCDRLQSWQEAVEGLPARAARGLVGHHRFPAQDRPEPARAGLAPDDQLPLLGRHRRGPGPSAALHRAARRRARGGRRREPARRAARASTRW